MFLTISEDGCIESASRTFRDWLEEYEKHRRVPVVSIDCKAISNRFCILLFTVNGRANGGAVLTLFMAFLSNHAEECFEIILRQFMSTIRISPLIIAMDLSVPCINASEKVFASSCVAVDEWHLNQN